MIIINFFLSVALRGWNALPQSAVEATSWNCSRPASQVLHTNATPICFYPALSGCFFVNAHFYRPQTKFAKVMFLQVCLSTPGGGMCGFIRGGACMVLFRGHVWFYLGGVRGFIGGGGMHGFIRGVCMVLFGGMRGCSQGGHAWLLPGGCMVAPGGMHGCSRGGMRGCSRGGHAWFFDEIRSMSGRYASYWNAFLSLLFFFSAHHVSLSVLTAGD